jgi:hypothetical protein
MEYIIENHNYPIINILNNIHIFELIYTLNTNLFFNFEKNIINDNEINIKIFLQNIGNITLDNFYLDLNVKKIIENNNIKFVIHNNDLEFDNIQFNYFEIEIDYINDNKYKIEMHYELNKDIYNKMINNIFNKILKKIFSNLHTYLCQINI